MRSEVRAVGSITSAPSDLKTLTTSGAYVFSSNRIPLSDIGKVNLKLSFEVVSTAAENPSLITVGEAQLITD